MAIIAEHRQTGKRVVVLGAGLGRVRGRYSSDEFTRSVAVCNAEGQVEWIDHSDLVVVSVDGRAPAQILGTEDEPYR